MADASRRSHVEMLNSPGGSEPSLRNLLPLITPGEFLLEEFLAPIGLSCNMLALHLHVPPNRIYQIMRGKRAITADTALRLSCYFGNSAEFWMNLQSHYELQKAKREVETTIKKQVQPRPISLRGRRRKVLS